MRQDFLPTIVKEKEKEVATDSLQEVGTLRQTYSLYHHIKANPQHLHIVSEIKKASPSLGDINLNVDILEQAKTYEKAGASMISVLTDKVFFKGDLEDLRLVSNQVAIPTLAKDFIIAESQIVKSLNAGATVILLIVAALPKERLQELYQFATGLGLEVLVETHNLEELEIAHDIGAQLIGVNNRNLTTFETNLETSLHLAKHFQEGPVYISESAIFSGEDAQKLAPYFDGILVGTALMEAESPSQKIKELTIDKG